MTKRILVTGGDGFIGTYVCDLLVKKYGQHNVLSMDNHTNYLGLIPQEELVYLITERGKVMHGNCLAKNDISDKKLVKRHFDKFKPTHVIHLAAFPRAKVVDKNPVYASETLVGGLLNVLENCSTVEHFVYISSSMVYGDFTNPVTEDFVCKPKGTYGVLKLAGESLVKDWARRNNKEYTVLRPSAVYGPFDVKDRVVSKFFAAAFNNEPLKVQGPDQKIDFTFVEDLAAGICSVLEDANSYHRTFNMARGKSRTLLEAAELIIELVGSGTIDLQDANKMYPSRDTLDCRMANYLLGYNPTTDIEAGFQKYYDFLQLHPLLRS